MTIVTFFFVSHVETHRLAGEWTRDDLRQRAKDLGAWMWNLPDEWVKPC